MLKLTREGFEHENTPEGRIAAVARALVLEMWETHVNKRFGPEKPDMVDFREAFRPFIKRELLMARIEEARTLSGRALTGRIKELAAELEEVNKSIPAELR
jgi:hypothetical protein